jgi:hypothetical protein
MNMVVVLGLRSRVQYHGAVPESGTGVQRHWTCSLCDWLETRLVYRKRTHFFFKSLSTSETSLMQHYSIQMNSDYPVYAIQMKLEHPSFTVLS